MLDVRLSAVLSLVKPCGVLADVGTDHGYLPLEALKSGICKHAVAADLNALPLKRAQDTFAQSDVKDKVSFVRCSGIRDIPDPIDAIVIAGMGAETVMQIVNDDLERFLRVPQLIFQVNKDVAALRRFMVERGFDIVDEAIAYKRHYYVVVKFAPSASLPEYNPFQLKYGPILLSQKDPIFLNHLTSRLNHILDLANRVSDENKREAFVLEADAIRNVLDKES
jgi:tRNA (adenine22-N1)-methyltransferase